MLDSIQQVVKREPSREDKKKEFVLIGICFILFLATYYLSALLAYFSFIGYLAAIFVVVWFYRLIRKYSYQFTYRIQEDQFSIIQTEGKRNPVLLCSYPLCSLKKIADKPDSDPSYTSTVSAAASETHPKNQYLTFEKEEEKILVAITPNPRILNFLKEILTVHTKTLEKEEQK